MDKATFEKGLEIRKSVLGAEFVEKSFASADDFNRPFQEFVTEYCWGAVLGPRGAVEEDAQHAEPRDDQRAQPAARAQDARRGRADATASRATRSARSSWPSPSTAACRPASTRSASRARSSRKSTRSKIRTHEADAARVRRGRRCRGRAARRPGGPQRPASAGREVQGAAHGVGRSGSAGRLAEHRHGRRAAAARVELRRAQRADRRGIQGARRRRSRRQNDEDNADFNIDKVTPEQEARGTVGGPVSPPPHWLERGKPSYQASLIVDPPDGRMPPQTPEGTQRLLAQRDAARRPRPGRLVRGPQPLRPVHHARRPRIDAAGHLQQRQPDHPGAGRRRRCATR